MSVRRAYGRTAVNASAVRTVNAAYIHRYPVTGGDTVYITRGNYCDAAFLGNVGSVESCNITFGLRNRGVCDVSSKGS